MQSDRVDMGRSYLTAPKVRPRTSWRWLNQPKTRIGRDGARRRGRQLGEEQSLRAGERGDEGGQRGRDGGGQVQAPERLVPAQDQRQQPGGRDAGQGQGQQQVPHLAPGAGAVHAAGLQDLVRHLLVEGEQHPDHDRQVHQRVDDDQARSRVEQPRSRGTAGRSAPARRPAAASWSTASTAGCRGCACVGWNAIE